MIRSHYLEVRTKESACVKSLWGLFMCSQSAEAPPTSHLPHLSYEKSRIRSSHVVEMMEDIWYIWKLVKDREAWRVAVHGSQRVGHD